MTNQTLQALESLREGLSHLGDVEIPYYVKYVEECKESGFDFPETVGYGYQVKKYDSKTKTSFVINYRPIFSGFDIETTNIIDNAGKRAYMYHAQMSVFSWERGMVYLARTWDEVKLLFDEICKFYNLGPFDRIVAWDANLGFEHTFMANRFEWSEEPYDFFAKEKNEPLLCTLKGGLEFRECLSISGGSLAQLCKDYTWTQKLKDDGSGSIPAYDYRKIRNSKTEMTTFEISYTINDVVPLAEFSAFIFTNYVQGSSEDGKGKIPLTKTGILRHDVKLCSKKYLKGKASDYKQLLNLAHPDIDTYRVWRRFLFRGGYVHANVAYVGKEYSNIDMYDITSSYPSRMFQTKMPTSFRLLPPHLYTEEYLTRLAENDDYSFWLKVHFIGLEATTTHSIESYSKCEYIANHELDNGRIRKADCTVYLTDYDWRIYNMFYKWKNAVIEFVYWSKNAFLPPYLLEPLYKLYKEKARLKKAGRNNEPIYAIKKSGVNASFGLTVTGMSEVAWRYSNDRGWYKDEADFDYDDEVRKSILLPQWGIWISSASKFTLLSQVYRIENEVGKDYPHGAVLYCDTDSIKCFHDPRIKAIIDEYNKGIAKRLEEVGLTEPEFNDLGMFDMEHESVPRFCTLGAKRYMMTAPNKKGVLETSATIAGLPKCICKDYAKEGKDPFDYFKAEGWIIGKEDSHKTTHKYNETPHSDYVDGELMTEYGSCAIYEIPFSMKLDDDFYKLVGTYILSREDIL